MPLRPLYLLALLAFAPVLALADPAAELFARHAEFVEVKISPDGRYLAATVPRDSATVLVIVDRKNMKSGTIIERGENNHIFNFHWANPERIIFQVERRMGGLDFPVNYGQIFAANANGKNHIPIFGYQGTQKSGATRRRSNTAEMAWGRIVDMKPSDPKNIIITSQPMSRDQAVPTLMELNVYSGVTRKLGRLPIRSAQVLTDSTHRARFAAGVVEGYEWEVKFRTPDSDDWIDMPMLSAVDFEPIGFTADETSVYGLGRDKNSVRGLYRYDIENESLEPVITGMDYDVTRPITDPRSGELLGVFSWAVHFSYHFVDTDNPLVPLYTSLLQAFKDQRVWITSVTEDGSELILQVANDKNPSDFFSFDTATANAKYLMSSRAWLDPNDMASVEPVNFEARDGTRIHGYITYPTNGERENLPMVIHPHGGPHGVRDVWAFSAEAQFLASRGYAVFQANYRGSGGYGKTFEESGYHEWGGKMQDDLTDATHWAVAQGIADADRICIYGASYGGYAALMGVAREPELYQCAVGSVGVYDLSMMYKKGDIKDWVPGRGYLEKAISDDVDFLSERSPVTHAHKIKVPVLLVHGGRDERAPIAHAKAMREAMKKAGNEPEWLVFKNEAHGYYDVGNQTRFLEQLEQFFARHIGT